MIDVNRYIEVYDNVTEELIDSYEILLPDRDAIKYINPDIDDEYAFFTYKLDEIQVLNLGGDKLIDLYGKKNVSFHASCYQK